MRQQLWTASRVHNCCLKTPTLCGCLPMHGVHMHASETQPIASWCSTLQKAFFMFHVSCFMFHALYSTCRYQYPYSPALRALPVFSRQREVPWLTEMRRPRRSGTSCDRVIDFTGPRPKSMGPIVVSCSDMRYVMLGDPKTYISARIVCAACMHSIPLQMVNRCPQDRRK